MKARVLVACLTFGFIACAQSSEIDSDVEPDTPLGSLTLMLKGTDSSGVSYWLRNAQFEINGWPEFYPYPQPGSGDDAGVGGAGGYPGPMGGYYYRSFSSEDYPDDTEIRMRLVPGNYNVALVNGDWYLERGTGDARERVEQVVLLTSPYQYVYVYDQGAAYVGYRFGVDGELIDFRSGELVVQIEIEKPGERCNPGWGGAGGGMTCGSAGRGSAGAPPMPIP